MHEAGQPSPTSATDNTADEVNNIQDGSEQPTPVIGTGTAGPGGEENQGRAPTGDDQQQILMAWEEIAEENSDFDMDGYLETTENHEE